MKKIFLILFFILINNELFSQEINYIGRSPRAQLMGDAFTAVADDEYTLFYNPASLGRSKSVSITPINPSFNGTNPIKDMDRFKNFPSDPVGIVNKIINYPISLQLSVFPGIKMGRFGLNLFANSKTNLVLRNAIHPILDIDYRYDKGFIAGYAHSFGSGAFASRAKKTTKLKITTGQRVSVGVGVKQIKREGMNEQFDLFGTTILNKVSSGTLTLDSIKKDFGYSKGKAWGVDLGVEYAVSRGNSLFTAGFSMLDIGDTRFKRTEGVVDVPNQAMTVNTGIAYKQDFGIFDYTLSSDLRPLNDGSQFSRKFHFGSELSLPLITLNAGWSEGYVSYGGSIKLWPIKLTAGFYGIEVGRKFRQQEAKRFIVYVSLFDFSLDI